MISQFPQGKRAQKIALMEARAKKYRCHKPLNTDMPEMDEKYLLAGKNFLSKQKEVLRKYRNVAKYDLNNRREVMGAIEAAFAIILSNGFSWNNALYSVANTCYEIGFRCGVECYIKHHERIDKSLEKERREIV